MNRGHALSLRAAGQEALVAYGHAITLLRPLPCAENPAWANNLGAALLNYGQLLHRVHGTARADEALAAFAEAIAVLTTIPSENNPWARRNLAGTWVNRANLYLDQAAQAEAPADRERAETDARAALALVGAAERDHLVDAELALKARRVLCDVLGQQFPSANVARQWVLAAEAGDRVDEALALIRHWVERAPGASGFTALATRFFRFGAELYRRHQPHFLIEFIEENLAAAPAIIAGELRAVARLVVNAALADGAAPRVLTMGDPATERAFETRRELAAAEIRLHAGSPFAT